MMIFVCETKCFEYILRAMYDHWQLCVEQIIQFGNARELNDNLKKEKLNWFGNELLKMNIQSFNNEYRDYAQHKYRAVKFNINKLGDSTTKQYRHELARVIKQIHCLRYQSCRLDNYKKDWRWKALKIVLNILNNSFVESSDEYENCWEWGMIVK
ncbi:MAG: hypothetical protein EOM59_16495 [Clostridia bacterium]|nr:hypothetical protein [Clostridia bacterium]